MKKKCYEEVLLMSLSHLKFCHQVL